MSDDVDAIRKWVRDHPLTLLVFTTADCGVCDALRPRVAELARSIELLQVRYVDVSDSPMIAGQYEVFAVPVYVLSVNGKESQRFARHFSMEDLADSVERYNNMLNRQ